MTKRSNPTFLLTGTYSSFNKGDAAMQLATARTLRKRHPYSKIVISTPFPEYDKETYSEFKIIKTNRRNLVFATLLLLITSIYGFFSRLGLNLGFLIFTEEIKETVSADIVIDLSGDTITEDYGPHVTYSHLLPVLFAQALGTPVYISAQSIGPFKLTKAMVKNILNKCQKVTAREKVTYDYLKSMGIKKSKLLLQSDMAFLLQPVSNEHVDSILEKEKISINNRVLGVTVSNIIKSRFEDTHTGTFEEMFAASMDRISDKLNYDILFIGHVTGPAKSKDDRILAKQIISHMTNKKRATLLKGDYQPDELKGIISKCSLFLGSRMHSNIGAISTHVPTVAISYSHKTLGIMQSVGLADCVLDGSELDEKTLYNEVKKLSLSSEDIAKKLKKEMVEVRKSSMKNIEIIEKIATNK